VTANLYLPAARSGRTAAVLFLSGHHNTAKQVPEYQSVCQTLVRRTDRAQDPAGQASDSATMTLKPSAPGAAWHGEHDYAGAQTRFVGDQIARYFCTTRCAASTTC
jgi:hypothetical protein